MHAFDWTEQTLKIYMQYSMYFACNNDLRGAVLTNLWENILLSQFFFTFCLTILFCLNFGFWLVVTSVRFGPPTKTK